MLRCLFVVVLAGFFASCAKPALPDLVVRASSSGDLASFRSDLGVRFTAEQIAPFDTALQELQLEAMNRNVSPAAAREADMLIAVNGQTVHDAQVLGWRARRERLLREIATFTAMRERDLKQQKGSASAGPTQSVLNRLQNEQDILARLARDVAEADANLAAWSPAPKK